MAQEKTKHWYGLFRNDPDAWNELHPDLLTIYRYTKVAWYMYNVSFFGGSRVWIISLRDVWLSGMGLGYGWPAGPVSSWGHVLLICQYYYYCCCSFAVVEVSWQVPCLL